MKNFLVENKDFVFTIACLVIGLICIVVKSFLPSKETAKKGHKLNNKTIVNNVNNIVVKANSSVIASKNTTQNLKLRLKILFIDDEKFNIIGILRKAGWNNVIYRKDIVNIDDDSILTADIIFVDINGVGCSLFKNQGLGLAEKIKDKYPEKKVVIYSAENQGNIFDPAIRKVDDCLQKNAEPIEFSNVIENLFGNNE